MPFLADIVEVIAVLWIRIRLDSLHFGNLDPDPQPHPDPHPHQIKIRIRIKLKIRIRVRIKVISWIRNRILILINLQMS
jgi:hypothetical protein